MNVFSSLLFKTTYFIKQVFSGKNISITHTKIFSFPSHDFSEIPSIHRKYATEDFS